jgi:putative oxidoreductase
MISSFGFLILRLCVGILLIHHGYEKLNDIENFANAFVRPLHLPFPITLSYIAALSEIVGSWMLITGLGVRLGALAIFGTMTIAIYHAIMTSGLNIYLLELLGLYWGGALCLVLNGGGEFSIDNLIKRQLAFNKT